MKHASLFTAPTAYPNRITPPVIMAAAAGRAKKGAKKRAGKSVKRGTKINFTPTKAANRRAGGKIKFKGRVR